MKVAKREVEIKKDRYTEDMSVGQINALSIEWGTTDVDESKKVNRIDKEEYNFYTVSV